MTASQSGPVHLLDYLTIIRYVCFPSEKASCLQLCFRMQFPSVSKTTAKQDAWKAHSAVQFASESMLVSSIRVPPSQSLFK